MKTCRIGMLTVLAAVVGLAGPLTAQTGVVPTGALYPEKPLPPAQKELRDAVSVLRDTLRAVLATAERMERAQSAGSGAVLMSSARVMAADCARASRGAARLQEQIKGFSTSEKRGDDVLNSYRSAILVLQRDMDACSTDAGAAIVPAPDSVKLAAVRTRARKAMVGYDRSVQQVMKTLSIPFEPKGHKSAIDI